MDRLITIQMGNFDRETEIAIAIAQSGVSRQNAEIIVNIVNELRGTGVNNHRPTIRATIAIARILVHRKARAAFNDPVFQWVCHDVLTTETAKVTREGQSLMPHKIDECMERVCSAALKARRTGNRLGLVNKGKE